MEVVKLPFCSMGKSTLGCLWDPNTKLSVSHLAELLSQAACQHCFRKCSSSAFQAVLQIHTDSCQEAFLSRSESETYRDRRGRQLVLVISDNTYHQVFPATRGKADRHRNSGQQLLWRCISAAVHIYLCPCRLPSSHREFMLQPTLKHSQTRRLSLPLSYFFSKINLVFRRVNFHFSMASAMLPLYGLHGLSLR